MTPLKMEWRLIKDGPGEGAWNMAMDEAISRSCMENRARPTLRFYKWIRPSVTIGRFQKHPLLPPETDSFFKGVHPHEIVRRITGGLAVFHDRDLTYSFSSGNGQTSIPSQPRKGFLAMANVIKKAFKELDIDLEWGSPQTEPDRKQPDCFSRPASFELLYHGVKILGCAQKKWKTGLLQQGTIRLEALGNLVPGEDLSRLAASLPLEILRVFTKNLGIRFSASAPEKNEWNRALWLEKEKYRVPDWNLRGKTLKI